MANKQISDLPSKNTLAGTDAFAIDSNGVTYKITGAAIAEGLETIGNYVTGVKGNSESTYRTGDVNITKANIGLGNVDNTSDANKPISTATQTALDAKLDKANVYNGLDQTASGYALDARQGKVLGDAVSDVQASVIVEEITTPASVMSFPDGAPVNARDLVVGIEPVQSGSGDPSPDNVRPISGWTGANVSRTGKNLCTISDKSISSSGYVFQGDLINNVGGILAGTYTVSFVASGFANGSALEFVFRDENDQTVNSKVKSLSSGRNSITITIERNAVKARSYTNSSSGVSLSDFQIEVGSTATPYEPYTGTTIPISWQSVAGTVYGGTLDVTTGLLTVDRGYAELDEGWSWNKSNRFAGSYYADRKVALGYKINTPFLCSHATTVSGTATYTEGDCYCDGDLNFYLMDANSTIQDWKDYIVAQKNNGTPITICYELATPQTYQLTPTEVEMLLGDNNVWADTGDVQSVEYQADTKLYIDKKIAELA